MCQAIYNSLTHEQNNKQSTEIIDPACVDNFEREEALRVKYTTGRKGYALWLTNWLLDRAVLVMTPYFEVDNSFEQHTAVFKDFTASNYETLAGNILGEQYIYTLSGSIINENSGKVKVSTATLLNVLYKNIELIEFERNKKEGLVMLYRGKRFQSKREIMFELEVYFASKHNWMTSPSIKKAVEEVVLLLETVCSSFNYYAPEKDYFEALSSAEKDLDAYYAYRDMIADSLEDKEQAWIWKRVYDMQLITFYRNCVNDKLELTELCPVLHGAQGVGKTYTLSQPFAELQELLDVYDIYQHKALADIKQDRVRQSCYTSRAVLFDDFDSKQSFKVIPEFKAMLSDVKISLRKLYTDDQEFSVYQRVVFFGTTNVANWLQDDENRRCPTFNVVKQMRTPDGFNFESFWKGVKYLATVVYAGITVKELKHKDGLMDKIKALHHKTSKFTATDSLNVMEMLKELAMDKDEGVDIVIVNKSSLFKLVSSSVSRNEIEKYILERGLTKVKRINKTGKMTGGIILKLDHLHDGIQELVKANISATFIINGESITTQVYKERVRIGSIDTSTGASLNINKPKVIDGLPF